MIETSVKENYFRLSIWACHYPDASPTITFALIHLKFCQGIEMKYRSVMDDDSVSQRMNFILVDKLSILTGFSRSTQFWRLSLKPWIYLRTFTGENRKYLKADYSRVTDSFSGQSSQQNKINAAKSSIFQLLTVCVALNYKLLLF